eukprot:5927493-Amphidinium_carterae.1
MDDLRRGITEDVARLLAENQNRVTGRIDELAKSLEEERARVAELNSTVQALAANFDDRVRDILAKTPPHTPRAPPGLDSRASGPYQQQQQQQQQQTRNAVVVGGWAKDTHKDKIWNDLQDVLGKIGTMSSEDYKVSVPYVRSRVGFLETKSKEKAWEVRKVVNDWLQEHQSEWPGYWAGMEKTAAERRRNWELRLVAQEADKMAKAEGKSEICWRSSKVWYGMET